MKSNFNCLTSKKEGGMPLKMCLEEQMADCVMKGSSESQPNETIFQRQSLKMESFPLLGNKK